MTAAQIAARLEAKPTAHGWQARCPAHEDRKASLSISEGDDDRILLKCHAGCSTADVVARAGLQMADLFPEKGAGPSKVVATYDYTDEAGALLFQVVRMQPKDFRQRRPDGKGGWTWKLGNTRRVLYRLPELKGESLVYVVEGEADADRLRAIALTATTNAGGAEKWREDYTRQLLAAGVKHVNVVPDNDDPGRRHAQQVAASCHAAGLTVKVVTIPGLQDKGDVSDYLRTHQRDDPVELVASTPLWAPPDNNTTTDTARRAVVTRMADVQPEDVSWIWGGRIARGKYTLLAGEPGLGKTYALLDVNARVSRGLPFPDGTIAPLGRSLKLTAEDGLADTLRPRLDALGADVSQISVLEAVKEQDGTRSAVSLVRDLKILAEAIREVQPIIVDIDPLTAYLGGTDTHRDSEVRSALVPILDMAAVMNFALVGVSHLSKDAQRAALHRPGGSIAFVAAARVVLGLVADQADPARRLLVPLKSNICRPADTLAFRINDERLTWETSAVTDVDVEALFRPARPVDREEHSDAERLILGLLESEAWPIEARTAIDAAAAHGIAERTLRWTARKLGIRIARTGFGRAGKWHWHRPDSIPATKRQESLEHPNVAAIAAIEKPSKKEEEHLKSVHRGNSEGALGNLAAIAPTAQRTYDPIAAIKRWLVLVNDATDDELALTWNVTPEVVRQCRAELADDAPPTTFT
jgi:putative DNA primase/helicase